jgi:DNA-directed RNA polymerase specialized sigma24 family protein
VVEDARYSDYCVRLCKGKDIHKDLYQYTILALLELDESTLIDVFNRGKLHSYIVGIMYKSIYGNRSRFIKEYNGIALGELDDNIDIPEPDEASGFDEFMVRFDEEILKECNRCIQSGVYPAAVKIYEIYEQVGSYKKVSECTRIPYKTVLRQVHETRQTIIKRINEDIGSNPT